jgi:IS4 transposase
MSDEPKPGHIPKSVKDANDNADNDTQTTETVHSGVSITAKVKRGSDTRDQDTLTIKGKGADAEEAAEDFEQALTAAEENGWADRLRAIQPEEADE